MVAYRRNTVANAPYFLTLTLRDRRATLLVDYIADLRAAFAETKRTHPFETLAIVILPEHLHWLVALPLEDADFSTRVRLVKRHFTLRLLAAGLPLRPNARGEYRVWQSRFWEHTIRDEHDWQQHVDYIHYNPVKHGVVPAVRLWPHSSFHRYVRDGLLDADWGGDHPPDTAQDMGEP